MRALALLAVLLGLLVATAAVSPAVAALVAAVGWDVPFGRVYDRVFEVLLVVAGVVAWRRLPRADVRDWGVARDGMGRDLARGVLIGAGGLAAALLFCWLAGGLVPTLRFPGAGKMASKTVQGLGAAAVVACFEEVVFRGVLLRLFIADFGRRGGALVTTVCYAAVHLIRSGGGDASGLSAGVQRTLTLFAPLAQPAELPTFVGLFAFGLVLVAARLRTGTIWCSVGIHAAWVALFRVGRLYVRIRRRPLWVVGAGWPPLIGSTTGAVGVAVTAALLAWALARRRQPH